MKRMNLWPLPLLFGALLGCGSSLEPRYHDLSDPAALTNGAVDRCVDLRVSVQPPYDSRSLGYRVAAGEALRWYRFERWSDHPEDVVAEGLRHALRVAGVRSGLGGGCTAVMVTVQRLEEVDVAAGTKSAEAWAELDAGFQVGGTATQHFLGRRRAAELEVPAVIAAFGEVVDEFAAVIAGQID